MDIFTYNSEGIKILLILGSLHEYIFLVLKSHALFQWHTAMINCLEFRVMKEGISSLSTYLVHFCC